MWIKDPDPDPGYSRIRNTGLNSFISNDLNLIDRLVSLFSANLPLAKINFAHGVSFSLPVAKITLPPLSKI